MRKSAHYMELEKSTRTRTDKPLTVLHVFDHSVPYFSGYTFRSGYILSNQRKMGLNPIVLTTLKHRKQQSLYEEVDGQHYYRTPFFKNPLARAAYNVAFLGEGLHMNRVYHRILEVYEEEKFDMIHAHSPALNGYPALRAARHLGIPLVYEVRAFWEDAGMNLGTYSSEHSFKYRSVRRFETYVCKKADAVTTICEGLKNDIINRGVNEDKIFVIPNCVETERFMPLARNADLMKKHGLQPGKVMGFIGSFYEYEGLDLLIRSFAMIVKDHPDMKLVLVGDGYQGQREKLEALSRELGLGNGSADAAGRHDRVVFTGHVPHQEVRQYYSVMDFMVYPRKSLRITELVTPLKPLEAMSMEKIVLGSSVGGIAELIEEGVNGFLFKPDDCKALADTFLKIYSNPALIRKTGPRSRRYVQEHRNWESNIERYYEVYNRAGRVAHASKS
ncbi:MAG: TIGR04063 family PEP-CTERM/XrtA system glycosyltransferase [Planctomycetota bacterium]